MIVAFLVLQSYQVVVKCAASVWKSSLSVRLCSRLTALWRYINFVLLFANRGPIYKESYELLRISRRGTEDKLRKISTFILIWPQINRCHSCGQLLIAAQISRMRPICRIGNVTLTVTPIQIQRSCWRPTNNLTGQYNLSILFHALFHSAVRHCYLLSVI